ncbi:MAG: transposase [Pseudohongiellaceae bacterium]|nr:transposase [Pseudohongiellaceae bacterium]
MPRPTRAFLANTPLHIIQRGNNKMPCFCSERDYIVYLGKLHEHAQEYNVAIHSFVLMSNHVHLLATPADATGISLMMQALGRYYVRYFNSCYERTGTLWEGRFKACLVDSENYLLTVSRYIELNPVRAHMVEEPADYQWSSFRHNALGLESKLITEHPVYTGLGQSQSDRQAAYLALFDSGISTAKLKEIRDSCNKSWVLGCSVFKERVESQLGYPLPPLPRGGDRKSENYRL